MGNSERGQFMIPESVDPQFILVPWASFHNGHSPDYERQEEIIQEYVTRVKLWHL